jgi:hypothetical protein
MATDHEADTPAGPIVFADDVLLPATTGASSAGLQVPPAEDGPGRWLQAASVYASSDEPLAQARLMLREPDVEVRITVRVHEGRVFVDMEAPDMGVTLDRRRHGPKGLPGIGRYMGGHRFEVSPRR